MMKKVYQLALAILISQSVIFITSAATIVPISPVISNGWKGGFQNAPSNMWFTLDQSTSMWRLSRGFKMKAGKSYQPLTTTDVRLNDSNYKKYVENLSNIDTVGDSYTEFGYIPYDENITYQIPVDYQGNLLPMPESKDKTWDIVYKRITKKPTKDTNYFNADGSQKDYEDIYLFTQKGNGYKSVYRNVYKKRANSTIPRDIFMIYAQYKWGMDMCYVPRSVWKKNIAANILNNNNCAKPTAVDKAIKTALRPYTKNGKVTITPQQFASILDHAGLAIPIKKLYKDAGMRFDAEINLQNTNYIIDQTGWHEIIPGLSSANDRVVVEEDSCSGRNNNKNCQIWKTFYSNRVLAVKSGLALALYKNLINEDGSYKNIRYGYQVFHKYITGGETVTHQIAKKFARLAQNNKTTNLKNNNKENLKEFYEWLFTYTPESYGSIATELRVTVADLLRDIKKGAENGTIFLEDPQKAYNEKTNTLLTCRQNHNIMFTDGSWNGELDDVGKNPLLGKTITNCSSNNSCFWGKSILKVPYNNRSTESNITLKDGKKYTAMGPYKSTTPSLSDSGMYHLADMAFMAWITDLDNNDNNNTKNQPGSVIVADRNELPTYIDENGKYKVYENPNVPQEEGAYWHPFYDLAPWQHINTHTIGFGLWEDKYKDIYINPPKTKEEAKKLFKMTKITNNGEETLSLMDGDKIKRVKDDGKHAIGAKDAITDLARAAMAGRGLFFNAKNGNDVVRAFDEIVQRAASEPVKKSATTGASGTAASSDNIGNIYLTTRYDGDSFTGELIKKELFNGENGNQCFTDYPTGKNLKNSQLLGEICDKSGWNAAKKLKELNINNRHILTLQITLGNQKLQDSDIASADIKQLKYKAIDFGDTFNLSPYQRGQLLAGINRVKAFNNISVTENNKKLAALFNYVKGSAEYEQQFTNCRYNGSGFFRSRARYDYTHNLPSDRCGKDRNILGALIRSSAVFSGKPNLILAHLDVSGNAYKNYINNVLAKYDNNTRKEVIYIGANDGMLHAFDAKTGNEIFAYVPTSIYTQLPKTVVPNKQLSLVDGKIALAWVNLGEKPDNDDNDNWQQILVGGFAGGGKGIYGLNITDANANSIKSATVGNWEYSELQSKLYNKSQGNKPGISNIGNILWEPAIIQLQDNTWVAITGNGYNSESGKAVLIVLDLATGKPIQELELPNHLADKPNGLSQLYFASYANKKAKNAAEINNAMKKINTVDRAYAGDLQGNLWVFDFTEATKKGGIKVVENKPLFTATGKVDGKNVRLPITAAPLVVQHPTKKGYLVHFGTGALFAVHDLSNQLPNALYAIWDDWIPTRYGGLANPRNQTVKENELNVITMQETGKKIKGDEVTIRYLETDRKTDWNLTAPTGGDRGWKINLTFDKTGGERAWQPAKMVYGALPEEVLSYRTIRYIDTNNNKSQCGGGSASVEGWDMVFNPNDAGIRLKSPATDTNNNGIIDNNDKIKMKTPSDNGGTVLITIPPTGVKTIGSFKNSATNTDLKRKNEKSCQLVVTLDTDSKSNIRKTKIPVCSYVSSWKELRQEKKK